MLTMSDILNVSDSFIHLEEFVDRTVETNQFQALVAKRYEERDAHQRIIAFYGQAGIGKTMLLDRLEFECIRRKVPYTRINFEVGTYNNTIEILREMVRELDPKAFVSWTQLDQQWFSPELDLPELNINVQGQQGSANFAGADVNVSGDIVAGSKLEIRNNTINMSTRAALDPLGAQTALTESFIKALGDFVQEHPAVVLFEGLDHEYCSAKTRVWVDGLLDRIRVLKGFGVLPIVTYFHAPNFEARLRSVTMRAELKPLTEEYIAEYFRARKIPENIIPEAAKTCLEETRGIPARVYEHTENMISALQEEIAKALVQGVVEQIPERAEPSQEAQESLPEEAAQAVESPAAQAPAPAIETSVSVQERIPAETLPERPSVIEQASIGVAEPQLAEEQGGTEPPSVEVPLQAEALLQAALPEEKVGGEALSAIEAAITQQPEMAEVVAQPAEQLQVASEAGALAPEAQVVQLVPEVSAPVHEAPPVEEAVVKEEQVEVETAGQQQLPQPVSEPVQELEAAAGSEGLPPETPAAAETAAPEQVETRESQETAEAAKRTEEAFHRSQERLKQQKSEGKSATASMVDALLGRQSEDVADIARCCAVLRWFTVDLIAVIAAQELKPEQAAEILTTISSWPFVQNFGYGTYAYRREIQQYLRAQLRSESPERFTEINRRAQAYFEKQLGTVNTADEMIWVNLTTAQVTALRENLYYLLQVDTARGFHLLGKLFQSAQRLYMHGEAAILLKFANEIDKSALGENHSNQLTYYEAALEFAEGDAVSAESKLRTLLQKTLDDELSAQAQGQLGVICAAGGKYDEAIKFFEQAQKTWQKLKRERERAKLSNNLGNVYMRKNDLNRAERSFNDALSGLKKAGTASESALTLNNLGNVYMQKENLSKALEHYQQSLQVKTGIGDQFGAANTYSNLGTVYQRMAQDASGKKQVEFRQQAADYYIRSFEAYRSFGARSNQGKLLFKLAFLYYQAGDKAKAKEYLPEALEIFRDLEMPDLENASKLERQLG